MKKDTNIEKYISYGFWTSDDSVRKYFVCNSELKKNWYECLLVTPRPKIIFSKKNETNLFETNLPHHGDVPSFYNAASSKHCLTV